MKQKLKKSKNNNIYSIKQNNPLKSVFQLFKDDDLIDTSDNLNTLLKEYYFNANESEILKLIVLNESDNCQNCNNLKCDKHSSMLKIDKTYLNLDLKYENISHLIDNIKKEVKTVKVSKQIPYDTWFIITNIICLAIITLTFIALYLF